MTTLPTRNIAARINSLRRSLANASQPENAINVSAAAAGIEEMMERSGLYQIDQMRPVRELFLDSRWVLGGMLRKMLRRPRGENARKTKSPTGASFKDELTRLNLNKNIATDCQRISTLPIKEKAAAYANAEQQKVLPTIELLIDVARPWWYRESRKTKHKNIAATAEDSKTLLNIGPFPLIYADPPWKFEIYSEKGLERTPDQHYPTLTDQEIIDFQINGMPLADLIHEDAALLLWCTSSNIHRALAIMQAWGFEYKSHAVWVKTKDDGTPISGLGLVFRNMHELLLYGTKGNMPGPQYQPPSVWLLRRGEHSAKPSEIRAEIEKMYPDFDEMTRLELFARETVSGWTCYGFESTRSLAAE
jgi:N6-adenosine-specific RNA methylase IME4